MKYFLLFFLLIPFLTQAGDLLGPSDYTKLSADQKMGILEAYKQFADELTKVEAATDLEEISLYSWSLQFIEEAYAEVGYNCFYAGWPSVKKSRQVKGKKRSYCSSPGNSNPNYKKISKSCGTGQMVCQPALFGKDLCIPVKTQAQRSSAYSQCQKKFKKSGKSLQDLVQEDHADEIEDLAELVRDVCSQGYQSTTSMCTGLKFRVSAITGKSSKVVETKDEIKEASTDELTEAVEAVTSANEKVEKINASSSGTPEIKIDCEETPEAASEVYSGYSSSEPIDQSKVTPADYCAGEQAGRPNDIYDASILEKPSDDVSVKVRYQGKIMDYKNSTPGGYTINVSKVGSPTTTLKGGTVPDDEKDPIYVDRTFSNVYFGRGKENTFEVIDAPIKEIYTNGKLDKRYVSTDLKRIQYSFFPRKVVPSITAKGQDLVMKMTTGEEIVVNGKTGKILSGVGKEVPWEKNVLTKTIDAKNKEIRTYIDNEFSYQGEGLYIQSVQHPNVNEKDPGSVVPVRALVNGKLQECKLKSEDLWEFNSGNYLPKSHKNHGASAWRCHKFKFENDKDFYDLIKKNCKDFKFPPLAN